MQQSQIPIFWEVIDYYFISISKFCSLKNPFLMINRIARLHFFLDAESSLQWTSLTNPTDQIATKIIFVNPKKNFFYFPEKPIFQESFKELIAKSTRFFILSLNFFLCRFERIDNLVCSKKNYNYWKKNNFLYLQEKLKASFRCVFVFRLMIVTSLMTPY